MGDPDLPELVKAFLAKAKAETFEADRDDFVRDLRYYNHQAAIPGALNRAARQAELSKLLRNCDDDRKRYSAELERLQG